MRVRTTRLTISKRLSTPGGVRVLYELSRRYLALVQAAIPAFNLAANPYRAILASVPALEEPVSRTESVNWAPVLGLRSFQ
jgi:hypothetical protein